MERVKAPRRLSRRFAEWHQGATGKVGFPGKHAKILNFYNIANGLKQHAFVKEVNLSSRCLVPFSETVSLECFTLWHPGG